MRSSGGTGSREGTEGTGGTGGTGGTEEAAGRVRAGDTRLRVLLLGGTGDARLLATELTELPGVAVTTSLAGRTADPLLPIGDVRVGGFGGPEGLEAWVREHDVDAVIDATHPFAGRITASAASACDRAGVPLCVLQRPQWVRQPGDDWRPVDSVEAAARVLAAGPWHTALLTTGRQGLSAFAPLVQDRPDVHLVVRSVDPPEPPLPERCEVVLGRGPFDVDEERALMHDWGVDVLVTKASGGSATAAKIVAARELRLPVVLVERPRMPEGVRCVRGVPEMVEWVRGALEDRCGRALHNRGAGQPG